MRGKILRKLRGDRSGLLLRQFAEVLFKIGEPQSAQLRDIGGGRGAEDNLHESRSFPMAYNIIISYYPPDFNPHTKIRCFGACFPDTGRLCDNPENAGAVSFIFISQSALILPDFSSFLLSQFHISLMMLSNNSV